MVSPAKKLKIERSIAYHVDELKRGLESGEPNEDDFEDADDTYFVSTIDNRITLSSIGEREVKYAAVVNDEEPITIMVQIIGGHNTMSCRTC